MGQARARAADFVTEAQAGGRGAGRYLLCIVAKSLVTGSRWAVSVRIFKNVTANICPCGPHLFDFDQILTTRRPVESNKK